MYEFCHIPKTGGTALVHFFIDNYRGMFFYEYIEQVHTKKCSAYNNPITIIRDPYERFKSAFFYWKYGSDVWNISSLLENVCVNTFIDHYLEHEMNETRRHRVPFISKYIFMPQSYWLPKTEYKNTIVIKYQKDLSPLTEELVEKLKLPAIKRPIKRLNNTSKIDDEYNLNDRSKKFIDDLYKEDFILYNLLDGNRNLFKLVIGNNNGIKT